MALPTPRYRIERIRLGHGTGFRITLLDHPDCSADAATMDEALRAVRVLFHQQHSATPASPLLPGTPPVTG